MSNLNSDELKARLELAITAGREAGRHTLKYFQRDDLQVEIKHDATPVTIADQEAEQLLRKRIAAAFPDDGILGEEFPETPGTSGYRWILDPIDGTKSFVRGVPLYGTMIGIERGAKSVVGVIYIPALDEGIYAAIGSGAWHFRRDQAPTRARVSQRRSLSEGLFCTGDAKNFVRPDKGEAMQQLREKALLCRTWGDCFGYMLVATGKAEVMIDPVMSVWDAAAVEPILAEAGGTFTDWSGNSTIHGGEGIATNGLVLEEVLAATRLAKEPAGAAS